MVFTASYVDVMSLEDGVVVQTLPIAQATWMDAAGGVVCTADGALLTIDYIGAGVEASVDLPGLGCGQRGKPPRVG